MSDSASDPVMTQSQFNEVQQEIHAQYQQQLALMQDQHNKQMLLLLERVSEPRSQPPTTSDEIKEQVQVTAKPILNNPQIVSTNTSKSDYGKATVLAASSKFAGDSVSYSLWSRTISTILSNVGLVDLLTIEDPNNKLGNDNAIMILLGGLTTNIAVQYALYQVPKRLWDTLESKYNRITETTKNMARKEFATCIQGSDEKVTDFTQRLDTCKARMECMEMSVSDEEYKYQLYEGLREEYASTISQLKIQSIKDINTIIQHIHDQGVLFEAKRRNTSIEETANYAGNSNRNGNFNGRGKSYTNQANNGGGGINYAKNGSGSFQGHCFNCNKFGHRSSLCPSPIKPCQHCGRTTHVSAFCKIQKQSQQPYQNQLKQQKDLAQMVLELQSALHKLNGNVDTANNVSDQQYATRTQTKSWRALLDSGATRHLINDAELISCMQPLSSPVSMVVANNQTSESTHGGKLVLTTSNPEQPLELDVIHAPAFKENLISVGKLVRDQGATVTMDNKEAVVTVANSELVAEKQGNLYVIDQNMNHSSSKLLSGAQTGMLALEPQLQQQTNDLGTLWHNRMGHMSRSTLSRIKQFEAVIEADELVLQSPQHDCVCAGCVLGRAHRQPFHSVSSEPPTTAIRDKAVGDLCGPIRNHYISSVIDVHSAKVAISILSHKSNTAEQVKQWDKTAKTQTGKPLKRFHTDGGTEYLPLKKYFNEQGTIMTTTTRDTPQHNGMAERMNRTILEKARSLLHHAHLPMSFWKEAVMTAVYIINRCVPSTGNRTITPEESWTGNKPSIKHMRVFGCNAYRHIMKKHRDNKLAPVARPGIFIGYDEEQVGYYFVWDIEDKKKHRTRDVTFDETSFTFGRSQVNLQTQSNSASNNDENTNLILLELIYNNIYTGQDHVQSNVTNDNIPPAEVEHDDGLVNEDQEMEQGEVPRASPQHGEKALEPDPIGNNGVSQEQMQQVIAREMEEHIEAEVHPQPQPQIEVQLRRSQRHQQPRDYYAPIINYNKDEEMGLAVFAAKLKQQQPPRNYWQAIKSLRFKEAMGVEMSALKENETWILTTLPPGRQAIDSMWLYDYKYDANGNIERYKARLVAKGYSQLEGIDYHETFAPVMKYKSLRMILALTAIMDLELVQMDVVTAFLNADIKEQVYMKQPQGYEQGQNLVCLLLKALYGTKQAPHDWNEVLNSFMLSIGFKRCVSDSCIYVRTTKTNSVILIGLFVDDLPIAYHKRDEAEWLELKSKFMSRFKMKDLGECKLILGMRVTRNRSKRTLKLDNQVKIEQLLSVGERTKWSSVPTPESTIKLQATPEEEQGLVDIHLYKSIVGSLNYLVQATRPDIAHAVNVVGRYASNPGPAHMMAVKRILRYLAGTAHQGLLYSGGDYAVTSQPLEITTWTDADWGGDLGDRKSTTGYLVKVNQCPVTWATKKQPTVALSTAEAEYMGIGCGVQEALWICQLLREMLGHEAVRTPSTILCDNQAVLAITKDDKHHQRTKHIDIKHHFVRDHVKNNDIIIKWIPTQQQQADLFTKGLGKIKFNKFKNEIMCDG